MQLQFRILMDLKNINSTLDYRDCRRIGDVLPWDDDFDLAVDAADYDKLNRRLKGVVRLQKSKVLR